MKAIKLILAFVIILALVVGMFFISTRPPRPDIKIIPGTEHEKYRQQFIQDWEQAGDWNESIFAEHAEIINQLSVDHSVDGLERLNIQTAMEIVKKKIFGEWKSSTCRKSEIDKYMKAVRAIESYYNSAKDDDVIIKIKSVNDTYRKALDVANLSIGLKPVFDGGRSSWNSYDEYMNKIKRRKNDVLSSNNYRQYLANIAELKTGLNGIDSKLAAARKEFYSTLASAIISYYSNLDKNDANLSKLMHVRDRYDEDCHNSNRRVDDYAVRFRNEVLNANKKNKSDENQLPNINSHRREI